MRSRYWEGGPASSVHIASARARRGLADFASGRRAALASESLIRSARRSQRGSFFALPSAW